MKTENQFVKGINHALTIVCLSSIILTDIDGNKVDKWDGLIISVERNNFLIHIIGVHEKITLHSCIPFSGHFCPIFNCQILNAAQAALAVGNSPNRAIRRIAMVILQITRRFGKLHLI